MREISKERLSNQIHVLIKEMIVNHRFQTGARINVEQIANEIGVSRTPVWEAVHRLVQEGLLVNVPNRGVFMATLTPSAAIELYTVRSALEALAAQLAARNMSDATIAKLEACIEGQRKIVDGEDVASYSRSDFDFHALIYEASGNRVLQEMLESIKNKMRPISMHIDLILPQLYHDHLEMMEAFRARDGKKAERAFRKHNRRVIEHIQKFSEGDEWKSPEVKATGRKQGPRAGADRRGEK